jgi:hypothetical protein
MLTTRSDQPPLGAFPRPGLVPYITRWSSERARVKPRVVVRPDRRGIGYSDERTYDRGPHGVLLDRSPSLPGKGRPMFGNVHPLRQQLAMQGLLCQVCGKPADRNENGVLWLIGEDLRTQQSWAADLTTSHPPLCLPCAVQSVQVCPHLRTHYTALRVSTFVLAGVFGALYRPERPYPVPVDTRVIAFDDPLIGWVRAGQLIMDLKTYSIVDLATGHAARE